MFVERKIVKGYTYYYLAKTYRVGKTVKKARIFLGPTPIKLTKVPESIVRKLKRKVNTRKKSENAKN